jgi:tyrosyl-tRNA synthetase
MYDFQTLKEAILFNTAEVLPTDEKQLDEELHFLVDKANQSGEKLRHYIGFEVSGKIHIGTSIPTALKVKKLTEAGVECHIWLADFHTYLNNKLDGRLETIRAVSHEYFGLVMLKSLEVVGCDMSLVKVLYADEEYSKLVNGFSFFDFYLRFAKELTLSRVLKSISIMGKEAGEGVEFGTLCYPVMQVADPFFLKTHFVHAGIDQRKCHVLMRETALKVDPKVRLKISQDEVKPIAIHHSLILGLEHKGENAETSKMSKSKPDSAIWVHDSLQEIQRKLKKAYCPMPRPQEQSPEEIEIEQEWNPMLDWCKKMIFPAGKALDISRPDKFGGDVSYDSFEDLKADYFAGKLHPMDLKNGVATTLANWFEPIRKAVEGNSGLEILEDLGK